MTGKAKTSFAEIQAKPGFLKREKVEIPEWGGDFYFKEISALDHQQIIAKIKGISEAGEDGKPNPEAAGPLAATWLSYLLESESGDRPDFNWLLKQSLRLLGELTQKALKFNGLTEEAKAETEKNSGSPEPGSSTK